MSHVLGLQYDISSMSDLQSDAARFIRFFDAVLRSKNIFVANGTEHELRVNIHGKDFIFPEHDYDLTDEDQYSKDQLHELERLRELPYDMLDYYKRSLEKSRTWRKGSEARDFIEEIELDEDAKKIELITKPQSLIGSAYTMWSIVRGLHSVSAESGNLHDLEGKNIRGFHTQYVAGGFPHINLARFEPGHNFLGDIRIKNSYSMHLNISLNYLEDPSTGLVLPKRLLGEGEGLQNLMSNKYFNAVCTDIGIGAAKADMMLLLANPNSFHRLSAGRLDRHHIDDAKTSIYMHDNGDLSRMEFRLADSSTDPFLAVLVTSAISFMGLSAVEAMGEEGKNYVGRINSNSQRYCKDGKLKIDPDFSPDPGSILEYPGHEGDILRAYYKDMIPNFKEHSVVLNALKRAVEKHSKIAEKFGVTVESIDAFATNAVEWAKSNQQDVPKLESIQNHGRFC